jgi:hypothetical protein
MPSRSDVVSEQLTELGQNLRDLWVALTTDPTKQKRKEQAWTILAGALTVAGTMLARRGTAKLWNVLTGEPPPIGPTAGKPAGTQTPAATPQAPDSSEPARAPSPNVAA